MNSPLVILFAIHLGPPVAFSLRYPTPLSRHWHLLKGDGMLRVAVVISLMISLTLVSGGCASWQTDTPLPIANTVELDALVVYSDFSLPDNHRLLREVNQLRDTIHQTLALPRSETPGEPVNVYLFKTPRRWQKFLKGYYPDTPDRRSFFLKTGDQLDIYALWGDRAAEDLRHEAAHAYLHAAVPNLPLWVDEGLAEYFEVPVALSEHRARLIARRDWRARLDRLVKLDSIHALDSGDYAESWAWIAYLMHTTPERRQLLQHYLNCKATGRTCPPLEQLILRDAENAEAMLPTFLKSQRALADAETVEWMRIGCL